MRDLLPEEYGLIQEGLFKFPGFYAQSRPMRQYPYPLAAHVLGYMGEANQSVIEKDSYYQSGDYVGVTGIEKLYEQQLRGRKGKRFLVVDVLNRVQTNYKDGSLDTAAQSGAALLSTIDYALQAYGEKLMANKRGAIVAIEPKTGEILASISSPSYDPNRLVGKRRGTNFDTLINDPRKPLFNRALMANYPPGSIFKLIVALYGLEHGIIDEDDTYFCDKGTHMGNLFIGCHEHEHWVNLKQAIEVSCNAYFCQLFEKILTDKGSGANIEERFEAFNKYLKFFGLGTKTGDHLFSESGGFIPSVGFYNKSYGKNRWAASNIISLSIGQGEIQLTPLQMANLAVILANGGQYFRPRVVRQEEHEVRKYTGNSIPHLNIVIEGMQAVVDKGTAQKASLAGIDIAGKTGTVQNPHGEDHSVFIAFAPIDDPSIAIAVIVENGGFGGACAAPIASLIIEKYLLGTITREALEESMIQYEPLSTF